MQPATLFNVHFLKVSIVKHLKVYNDNITDSYVP